MSSGLEDQIARLEAVATRLEKVALGGKKKAAADEVELSEGAEEFVEFRKNEVEAALKAIDAIPNYVDGVEGLGVKIRAAYDNVTDYVCKSDSCKEPTGEELQQALAATIAAIGHYDGLIYSRKKGMMAWQFHHKALHAAMDALTWVSMKPPHQMPKTQASSGMESTDFNLNKIIMKKPCSDENKAFVVAMKALGKRMTEIVKAHYKTGLPWSGTKNVLEASAANTTAAPAATEEKAPEPEKVAAKKVAPKKAAEPKGDIADELSKGLAITGSLKKVKKSQRNKYKKEKISGKVTGGPKKAKAKKKLPDPKKTKRGKTWFLEYFQEGLTTIDADFLPNLDASVGLFIASSLNCQFLIAEGVKVKSIVIDSCKRVQVQSGDIVSTIEMVNSQNCTLWLNGVTPALTVDKCDSPKIVLMQPCYDQEKQCEILTSNVTAGNVELPPVGDADGVVLPIPEQFFFKVDKETQTAKCEVMEHAG